MSSPYADLSARSFWKTGVVEVQGNLIPDLYQPKFAIDRTMPIATAGSCFAQRLGAAMRDRGFNVLDAEPAPPGLDGAEARSFGYCIYSARYANIYTVRQFVQLVEEALGRFTPAEQVWEREGRFFDAMRPSVEPQGLASPELVLQHRAHHLAAVRKVLGQASVLVFTMGLTESWVDRETGCTYPTAPGTIAGRYDPSRYVFKNYDYPEIYADFVRLRALLKEINPALRMLITVSPVPITATAGSEHVLAASTYTKSVLRAVAGRVAADFEDVDYFPSYEVVVGPQARGRFYADNLRAVEPIGLAIVMATFFGEEDTTAVEAPQREPAAIPQDGAAGKGNGAADPQRAARRARRQSRRAARINRPQPQREADADEDVVCEEALLEAFAR